MPDFTNFYPWKDLITGAGAFHLKKMGNSIWLFLYLVFEADPGTNLLRKNYADISREMSVKKRTIRYWLKRLKDHGYISTLRGKTGLLIKVNGNFLPDGRENSGRNMPQGVTKHWHSRERQRPEKPFQPREKKNSAGEDNANVNEDKLNNANEGRYENGDKYKLDPKFQPSTREELLALDLARGLDDTSNFAFYLSVSQKYPEEALRVIYQEVRETPLIKIKRSRGALFCYLLKKRLSQDANSC